MTVFSTSQLRELIARLPLPLGVVGVYLFGSARHKSEPNDLDLLLVYDAAVLPPEEVIPATESLLCTGIGEQWHYAVDLTALTIDEERSSRFISSEGAIPIWVAAEP